VIWGWTFVWMKQALSQARLTLGKDGEGGIGKTSPVFSTTDIRCSDN